MEYIFSKMPYAAFSVECKEHMSNHWDESLSHHHGGVPLDLDDSHYRGLEDAGVFSSYVVRHAGEIVGYAMVSVYNHHMIRTRVGVCENWYVCPEHRGKKVAKKLLWYVAQQVKAQGAQKLVLPLTDGPVAEHVAKSMGFGRTEVVYMKDLN